MHRIDASFLHQHLASKGHGVDWNIPLQLLLLLMLVRKYKKSNLQQLKKSFINVIQILIKWNIHINMKLNHSIICYWYIKKSTLVVWTSYYCITYKERESHTLISVTRDPNNHVIQKHTHYTKGVVSKGGPPSLTTPSKLEELSQ